MTISHAHGGGMMQVRFGRRIGKQTRVLRKGSGEDFAPAVVGEMQLSSSQVAAAANKSSDDGRTLLLSKLGCDAIPPAVLPDLDPVHRLALSYNNLADLPNDFSKLANLRYLNLRGNQFIGLPDVLTQLPALDTLDVSHNKLRRLPAEPGNLIHLKTLVLTRNLLTSLPSYLSTFTQLKKLHVERNPLEWPPRAVLDVQSKKDSDEGMEDWVHSLQVWMEADVARHGNYSSRQDDSGYGSADAGKDLESSLEDSFNSWSRFAGSGTFKMHRRNSSSSSATSLVHSRGPITTTPDSYFDAGKVPNNTGSVPHGRSYSIDSTFSIDSIAESEFEDADPDVDVSISGTDSDYLNMSYGSSASQRHQRHHQPSSSYASSFSSTGPEVQPTKDGDVQTIPLRLGILQTHSNDNSPIRAVFDRDEHRESYLPSPAHSEDLSFFDDDDEEVSHREQHDSGITDTSSTSTGTLIDRLRSDTGQRAGRESHQRNHSSTSASRGLTLGAGFGGGGYGSNALAKKSLPDLRTAKLNFTKKHNAHENGGGGAPLTLQQNTIASTLEARRRQRRNVQAGAAPSVEEEYGMPSPLSQRQDSGSSHGTTSTSSARSGGGGIRPLFTGTGRTLEGISPTRTGMSTGIHSKQNSLNHTSTPPPPSSHHQHALSSNANNHAAAAGNPHASMASERNSYFRRLSTLPSHRSLQTLPPALIVLVDSARSILFALSQIYQVLETFILNDAPPSSGQDDSTDRVTLILRKVLGPASMDLKGLIAALSKFDDAWLTKVIPAPALCRGVVETSKDAVTAFSKVVNVLSLQLPLLFENNSTPDKSGEDARFERALLLMMYGAMAEIAGAWGRLAPVQESLVPLLREREPRLPGRPPFRTTFSRGAESVHLTHTARRHAGSFSIRDVELGKDMPSIDEPSTPSGGILSALSPFNSSSRLPTPRAPKRKVSGAYTGGSSPGFPGLTPGSTGSYSFSIGPPSSTVSTFGSAQQPGSASSANSSEGARSLFDSHNYHSDVDGASFIHSRHGSQASSLQTSSPASSPLVQSKHYHHLDPLSSSTSRGAKTVDTSAVSSLRDVLKTVMPMWDKFEDVLLGGESDGKQNNEVREELLNGRALTRRLWEFVSSSPELTSRNALGDDCMSLLKSITCILNAYKARFTRHGKDGTMLPTVQQLNNSAMDLAMLLRVASFGTSSASSTAPVANNVARSYSPVINSPVITTTVAPPTPTPMGAVSPRTGEEQPRNRPHALNISLNGTLGRSRSAQASASAKLVMSPPIEQQPRSALPSGTFQIPPSPVLKQQQRRRDLNDDVGDPG